MILGVIMAWVLVLSRPQEPVADNPAPHFNIEPSHPWRPPFGLERVTSVPEAVVQFEGNRGVTNRFSIEQFRAGPSLRTDVVKSPEQPPFVVRIALDARATEVALVETDANGSARTIARLAVVAPETAIEAVAEAEVVINPIDLDTIFVPAGTLLLGPKQGALVDIALLNRVRTLESVQVSAWFASQPKLVYSAKTRLVAGKRNNLRLQLTPPANPDRRDALQIEVSGLGGQQTWQKTIPVMFADPPTSQPQFGARRTRLRYDEPISIRDRVTGVFTSLNYQDAWDPTLDDVVVCLPNGARFVFWRGSSYIPFWASRYNTGLCMEWAEDLSRRPDAVDCVEPLMDKELRYGRVAIIESTNARVHVRWSYQSTDLDYKTWGDLAVEDYYFTLDGFGTRVLTLKSDPATDYELSEFIALTPQGVYPLDALPEQPIDVLLMDGAKEQIRFPVDRAHEEALRRRTGWPAVYRVRANRRDANTAVYFNPADKALPQVLFGPFYDQGLLVTPAYWGSHWPLARGNATGSAIDARIALTPTHSSLMSWAKQQPEPTQRTLAPTLDAKGSQREMLTRRWAWLIGVTDAPDADLMPIAQSYAHRPTLNIDGGELVEETSFLERRAIRISLQKSNATIEILAQKPWTHPCFELASAPTRLERVELDGRLLRPNEYAWDGTVLWLDTMIQDRASLTLAFANQ